MSAAPPAKPALTRPAPWAFAAPWGARGYVSDLDGPVHWIEMPDTVAGPLRDWLGRHFAPAAA